MQSCGDDFVLCRHRRRASASEQLQQNARRALHGVSQSPCVPTVLELLFACTRQPVKAVTRYPSAAISTNEILSRAWLFSLNRHPGRRPWISTRKRRKGIAHFPHTVILNSFQDPPSSTYDTSHAAEGGEAPNGADYNIIIAARRYR